MFIAQSAQTREHVPIIMAVRRTRDEQVLEAIFNPENPVTDLEVSGRTDNQFYTSEESVAQALNH